MNASPPAIGTTVLGALGLVKRFGGIPATDKVTLNLARGARHALIGPNGAGRWPNAATSCSSSFASPP